MTGRGSGGEGEEGYAVHLAGEADEVLDVHGRTVEEAEKEIAPFLDRAFVAGVRRVRIIHGKGTGRLRRAVWTALGRFEFVEGYRYADVHEGSYGATVVDLAART